jgi:putative heme-binding domain-containing protein
VLSEPWLTRNQQIQEQVLACADDPDARVRFQAALSLGQWDDDRLLPALAKIATVGAGDRWTRAAVASAVPQRCGALLAMLLSPKAGITREISADRLTLVNELALLVGARREPAEVAGALDALVALAGKDASRWQMAGLNGVADGLGRRGGQLSVFLKTLPENQKATVQAAEALLAQAGRIGADTSRETAERLEATRLLAHAPKAVAEPVLLRLLTEDPIPEVRLAAVRALAAQPSADTARLLMESWRVYTPSVRREVIEAMLRQPDRIQYLLGELEAKRITPGDLDALSTRRLLNHGRADIRARAQKLLKNSLPEERKLVLQRYQEALGLKGDALRGRDVFKQQCGNCHQVAGVGLQVGPDISDTRTKTPEMLLLDILNPNAAIDANFVNYLVVTKNGKTATGVIAAETAASITLRRAENQTEVILRQDIEEMRSSGQSLMPEGVEKVVSVPQMADLLAFLKNWRYLDGAVPGK